MLHAWYETIFKKIGGKFGEFAEVSKDTIERDCLEFGKALVRIGSHCFVNEESEHDSFGRLYFVAVREEYALEGAKRTGEALQGKNRCLQEGVSRLEKREIRVLHKSQAIWPLGSKAKIRLEITIGAGEDDRGGGNTTRLVRHIDEAHRSLLSCADVEGVHSSCSETGKGSKSMDCRVGSLMEGVSATSSAQPMRKEKTQLSKLVYVCGRSKQGEKIEKGGEQFQR